MDRAVLVERAKLYLQMLSNGVHPVTGASVPGDSAFVDPKVKRCFSFITEVLDEYIELKEKVEQLERNKDKNTIVVAQKQAFSITPEQCDGIRLSKEPVSVLSFMKNINAAIDTNTTEKLSSTRVNKWLVNRGLVTTQKVQTVTSKTVYKPSEVAVKIGITEETVVDPNSGEVKTQIKLGESAQLFIIENMEDIIQTTKR
jgi:hypothetical protein